MKDFDNEEKIDLTEEEFDLSYPFDPKDINIELKRISLFSLVQRMKYGEINLGTSYQRNPDLWSKSAKSRLIESILIKFPLPSFYFDATNNDCWQVIDGLQRLSTLRHFILDDDDPLKLTGLEYLIDLNGKTYENLPSNMIRRLEEEEISAYLIKPGTPKEVKYSIFYRINTTGLTLNGQEIRNALNQGQASDFLKEIADNHVFQNTVNVSDKRMQGQELILRHMAFKLHSYKDYKSPMNRFLNEAMEELNLVSVQKLKELKNSFLRGLKLADELLGDRAFSKDYSDINKRSSLNRSLFEVWTVLLSDLDNMESIHLVNNSNNIRNKYEDILNDDEFNQAISLSTTSTRSVRTRFRFLSNFLQNYI